MHSQADTLQPPQSLDAEQAVLGAIMKDDVAINVVIDVIPDETYFYAPKHRMIYFAMLELYGKSEPCDITTVSNCLLSNGMLEKIGGRVYLVELVEGVASTANVKSYAEIVLEKSLLRELIETSNEITRSAYSLDSPVEDLLDAAESHIFSIAGKRVKKGFRQVSSVVADSITEIDAIQSGRITASGVLTGFTDVDNILTGLKNGDLIIIAGRPSMGKSAFTMNIAEHVAARKDAAVAVFSMEMTDEQVAKRMLCSNAKISMPRIQRGGLTEPDWRAITNAGSKVSSLRLYIDDSNPLSSLQVSAKVRRLKSQVPDLSLVIIDYMQMMHAPGRYENKNQEVAAISRSLKALAKDMRIPIIAVSQLSRAVEQRGGDKRPQLADLRESGAIEQDADVVMFVYRPEYYLSDDERHDPKNHDKLAVAEIIVAKQRNGATGTAKLTFIRDFALFENRAHECRGDGLPYADNPEMPF